MNKTRLTIIGLIILIAVVTFIGVNRLTSESSNIATENSSPSKPVSKSSISNATSTSTIASHWQWPETLQPETQLLSKSNNESSLPFSNQSVYDALQAIKIDDNGDIVLDHDALISLDEALERIQNKLDASTLLTLQDMIMEALPGSAGKQTAQLVGDYHNFLQAQEEFNQINSQPTGSETEQTLESIDSDAALYAELQALRAVYLGAETTERLFKVSDANAHYMFDSIKLGLDTSLTAEDVAARRQQIEARHDQQLANFND